MIKKYAQGATFNGALSYFGFGIFCMSLFYIFGLNQLIPIFILVSFAGLALFIQAKGVLIDFKRGRFKPYIDFLFFKLGFWYSTAEIASVNLGYFNESQDIFAGIVPVYTHTVRCYEIYFILKNKEKHLVCDVKSHGEGYEECLFLAESLQIPFVDKAPAHKTGA
jgi:hypothetical protein